MGRCERRLLSFLGTRLIVLAIPFLGHSRCPPQSLQSKPFPNLVGRCIQIRMCLPLILIEKEALNKPCRIKATDAHADQPNWKMVGRQSMTKHLVGSQPKFVCDVARAPITSATE